MLTRPGSTPGSGWMRNVSERLASGPADPRDFRAMPRRYWFWYIVFMSAVFIVLPLVRGRVTPPPDLPRYESTTRIAGVPLFASGRAPVGIIAVGGLPRGVIAIGGVAVGVIAIGGLAVGGLALGGLSLGFAAAAGLAIGWWAAGGGAIGYHAFGGLAVGGYAYAGNGVAYGYHEASGRQKEKLFG